MIANMKKERKNEKKKKPWYVWYDIVLQGVLLIKGNKNKQNNFQEWIEWRKNKKKKELDEKHEGKKLINSLSLLMFLIN